MDFKELFYSVPKVKRAQHLGISTDDIISFFEKFSTLIETGTPILKALTICSEQTESKKLEKVLKDVSKRVSRGDSVYSAVSMYPKIFKRQWCEVINVGEVTGKLAQNLIQLKIYIQDSKRVNNKVKTALIYPSILVFVAIVSVFIMLWKVVPTFATFFRDSGAKLPDITQFIINMSNFIKESFYYIIGAVVLIIVGIKKAISTYSGKKIFDVLLLATPARNLLIEARMEKFATNLSLLLKNGINILEAFDVLEDLFKDEPVYYEVIVKTHKNVARGKNLSDCLEESNVFTPMLISMIRLGEDSGRLDETLEKAAIFYREQIEISVFRLTSMIEPVIIVFMGAIFAGILLSIYIPMFDLSSKIS